MLHARAVFEPTPFVEDAENGDAEPITQRATRRDALPDFILYVDDGCSMHPACLTCPFVRCRYDAINAAGRDAEVIAQRAQGRKITEIAQRFGVSRRSIFRILAVHRAATA